MDLRTVVIHAKPLQERKAFMESQLKFLGFKNFSFYEKFDAEELTPEIIKKYHITKEQDPSQWEGQLRLWGKSAVFSHKDKYNPAQISLTIKWGQVLQDLQKEEFENVLILEDDALFCDGFNSVFEKFYAETPPDWDAIYLGSCVGLRPKDIKRDKRVYFKEPPASKGACSVLLKRDTVDDLASSWFPFRLISDFHLAWLHFVYGHKVYWWHPPLTAQGSEIGLFKSSLSP